MTNREEPSEVSLLKRQIETFYRVSRFISSIDSLDDALDLIMHEAEAAVEAEASCIAPYDPVEDSLTISFASADKSEGVRQIKLGAGQGILGEAAAGSASIRVGQAHRPSLRIGGRQGFRLYNSLYPGDPGATARQPFGRHRGAQQA